MPSPRTHHLTCSLAVGTALAFGGLATAASAATAATLTVSAGCYVIAGKNAPPMDFVGTGFTPGSSVLVSSRDGTVDKSVTADVQGNIAGRADAPTPFFATPTAKKVILTASQQAPTALSATATVNITELGWEHGSTKRQPGLRALTEKTNWSFSGFLPGRLIYGHYLFKGKQVALAKFGRAAPPCGTLKVRARLYPATPHHASFSIQYDNSKRYTTKSRPRIIGPLKLTL